MLGGNLGSLLYGDVSVMLSVIADRLRNGMTLRKRTHLEVRDVMELCEYLLTTTYFMFREIIYRQNFGTAMGRPVSPIVAHLFMSFFEQKAITSSPLDRKPTLWKRYVDDILENIKVG